MTIHACTIIARNYLAAARVLAKSFLEHHPDGAFTTLVIDDLYATLDDSSEPFEVLRLDQIGIDEPEMLRMAAIYSVMELSTAVKPWLLRTLLDRGATSVLYLDPDIKVFASLGEISQTATEHGIVLTPHITHPLPRDGRSKSETEVLESGIYNLGFIAVATSASKFLDFWQDRLARECISDPKHMRFVDQRWIDFVPGIFDTYILRDPGCNVAYWNLDHREITLGTAEYQVNGGPLRFFHFSGYDPRSPYLLSKHQGLKPRVLLSERPMLKRLCDEYAADLFTHGYAEGAAIEYGYARLLNGMAFDPIMRRLYRDALLDAESQGLERPPNPLAAISGHAFVEWLNEPTPNGRSEHLTRYLQALYEDRPDLIETFPDPDGENYERFVGWTHHEVAEHRLDVRLATLRPLPGSVRTGLSQTAPPELVPGIRITGYLQTETGVGELGRLAVAAAQRANIPTSTHIDRSPVSRQLHPFEESKRDDLNVNLICINADELPNFARYVGREFFAGRYTIGLWAWELQEFPRRFDPAFDFVNEIWAISEFTRAAIAEISPKPVFTFPLPIVEPAVPAGVTRADLELPEGFCFLFCFDLMSIAERKNPLGLIEAFTNAFSPGEGPTLVIKAVNGERKTADLERLKLAALERKDIIVIDRYFDAAKNAELMASCDCYVSLHRSEGFGLTLGEAMALGKPVIATAYSGNLDFMTESNSYLVPFTLGEVPIGCEPYPRGARWADPDLNAAAQLMREVFENPAEANARGARAREHVLSQHGIEVRARFIAERFAAAQEVIVKDPTHLGIPDPNGGRTPELIDLARGGSDINAPSRHPRSSRLFRRLVQRALRHHDAYQRQMNLKLAMGVEHVARLLSEMQAEMHAVNDPSGLQTPIASLEKQIEVLKSGLVDQGHKLRTDGARLKQIEDGLKIPIGPTRDE